jgi:hypothetical protein
MGLGTAIAQTQPPTTPPAPPTTPAPPAPATPAPATPAPAPPAPAEPAPVALPEPAPLVSEEATLNVSSVEITLPALPDATLVGNFTTVLGAGAVYRGSVSGAFDQIAQALVTAGFTEDAADSATADAPADPAAATTDAAAPATPTDAAAAPATATPPADPAATATPAAPATDTAATTDTTAAGAANTAATPDTTATADAPTAGLDGLPDGVVRTFTRGGEQFELRAYERGGFTVVLISRLGSAATTTPAN